MNEIAVDAEKVSEFKLKITHVVTIGCSWTYCQGLDNPSTQGWPALVAKKLNVPLVNLAVPGAGNDFIHRVSHEYIYRNLPTNSKPLFIIAWSQYWRRETWQKRNYNDRHFNDYAPFHMPEEHEKLHIAFENFLVNFNYEDFFRKTFLYKLSLMNLFKVLDIPYMMTDYSYDTEEKYDFLPKLAHMSDLIDNNPYRIEHFYKIASDGEPKLPCGHDGEKTQKVVANYTINEINRLFPNLKKIDGNFFTLNDFLKTSKYHQKFPEWCKFKV